MQKETNLRHIENTFYILKKEIGRVDVFDKYLDKYELIRVKTTNMGSLFKIKYKIILKNSSDEKMFIDDIRVRNGNLEVCIEKTDFNTDL